MASRRLQILLSILIFVLAIPPAGFIALLVLDGCGPRERRWETIETFGKCKLRTRGVNIQGDIFGRGKFYDLGKMSLWHHDRIVLPSIQSIEKTRDDRWAIATVPDENGEINSLIQILDIQRGVVIHRTDPVSGQMWSSQWDPQGLRLALGLHEKDRPKWLHIEVIDMTPDEVRRVPILASRGDVVVFPRFAWSPDSSMLMFEVLTWGTRNQPRSWDCVLVEFSSPVPKVLSRTPSSGGSWVDWTHPRKPVLN